MTIQRYQCSHCGRHDENTFPTVVCKHLAAEPEQFWHAGWPSDDGVHLDYWPDAWCEQCHETLRQDGGWEGRQQALAAAPEHEREAMVRATLENDRQICNLCYEGGMASGMEAAESNVITQWQAFVDECNQELIARQNSLEQQFSLSRYAQWRCDQTAGQLVFSGHGDTRLIADVEFIGTCSEETGTWLWAWANFHLAGTIRNRITAVQQFGDAHALPRLTIRKWPASEQDGWEMAAIAARLLDARGVYRAPLKNGPLFMAIMDIRHAPTGSSY